MPPRYQHHPPAAFHLPPNYAKCHAAEAEWEHRHCRRQRRHLEIFKARLGIETSSLQSSQHPWTSLTLGSKAADSLIDPRSSSSTLDTRRDCCPAGNAAVRGRVPTPGPTKLGGGGATAAAAAAAAAAAGKQQQHQQQQLLQSKSPQSPALSPLSRSQSEGRLPNLSQPHSPPKDGNGGNRGCRGATSSTMPPKTSSTSMSQLWRNALDVAAAAPGDAAKLGSDDDLAAWLCATEALNQEDVTKLIGHVHGKVLKARARRKRAQSELRALGE